MSATIPPPSLTAAWLCAGAMQDGISLWLAGQVIQWHGPSEARKKWARVMHHFEVPIRCYLALEVYPARETSDDDERKEPMT